MTKQLDAWQGDFGRQYTERNAIDWRMRLPAFRAMLDGLSLHSVLEVGCNRGHNLAALRELLGQGAEIIGVEPNAYARQVAQQMDGVLVVAGDLFGLPFDEDRFDLAFTAGVLIHVAPDDLDRALSELHRCSRRYILALEYFAEEETSIPYRGQTELLWKRDFLAHYRSRFPELSLCREGFWGVQDGFDRVHWWLLEKPAEGGPPG